MSRAEGFAAIPNWMIRDRRVPRSALLVYASLSSRSGLGGIYPGQTTIAAECGLSVRTVRSMLAELEALGVIERVRRVRAEGRGRLSDGYVLHPNAALNVAEEQAAESAGKSDQPANLDRPTGNQPHLVPLIEVEPLEVEPAAARVVGFADFYMAYPRKVAKEDARKAWDQQLKRGVDPQLILDGARRYAADPNLPDKRFIPLPATWLRAGRWDDEPEAPRSGSPAPVDLPPGEDWARFIR